MSAINAQKTGAVTRPPVIVVMGHIDHGKSTLLDYIRKSNVALKEVGGITQNISAYEVIHHDKKITFLDTPGHEAFSKLRNRGANVADIAILVVSAEDGVKPQTIEAYKIIVDAKLPLIVAINKIDKENADIERTRQSLLENEIYLEGYGGTIPSVNISAKEGKGIPELLDMTLLVSELEELKADPRQMAEGVVVEASRDKTRGISATMIIKNGTLKGGMFVAAGNSLAPVRLMENFLEEKVEEATFSSPIKIVGFDKMPTAGSTFYSFTNKKEAEEFIKILDQKAGKFPETQSDDPDRFTLPLVIKADTSGIIEAIEHEITKLETDKVAIKILYCAIGEINDDDIKIASGKPETLVIGFGAKASAATKMLADRLGITIYTFDIIYKLEEWLKEVIEERTPKIETEEKKGSAKILKLFSHVKDRQIVGGRVEEGTISLGDDVKIMRRDSLIGQGKIKELQQAKTKTKELGEGNEFGAMIESKIEIAPGDRLECFVIMKK